MVRQKTFELVTSYVLLYENSRNPHILRKQSILSFIKENTTVYVDIIRGDEVKRLADNIITAGIKSPDAHHVACAILGNANYFITTDNRLLKFQSNQISVLDPTTFIRQLEDLS